MITDRQILILVLVTVILVMFYCLRSIWVLSKENCEYEERQKIDSQTIDWQGKEIARLTTTNKALLDEKRLRRAEKINNTVYTTPTSDEWENLSRRYIEYWKTIFAVPPGN